ncbi:MAG: caspase family protein [Acidobacteriota bacterium]
MKESSCILPLVIRWLATWLTLLSVVAVAVSQEAKFVVQTGHAEELYKAVFTPDSRLLASIDAHTNVLLWDVQTGRQLRVLDCLEGSFAIAFSSNWLLVGINEDGKARYCDVTTGQAQRTVEVSRSLSHYGDSLSPDGNHVAFGSSEITVIDLLTGERKKFPTTFDAEFNRLLTFDRTGQLLAVSDGRQLHVWNIKTGLLRSTEIPRFDPPEIGKGHFPELDKAYQELVAKEPMTEIKSRRKITAIAFSNDLQTVTVATTDEIDANFVYSDGVSRFWLGLPYRFAISTWSIAGQGAPRSFSFGNNYSGTNRINSLAFSSDDQSLVTGSGDGSIQFWNASTGKEEANLEKWDIPNRLAFSADMKLVARMGREGRFEIWDVGKKKSVSEFGRLVEPIQSLKFSRNREYLAVGFTRDRDTKKAIKLLDLRSGKTFRTLSEDIKGADGYVYSLEFNNDATLFASASGRHVKMWNVRTGAELEPFGPAIGKVNSIAFSPDGKWLASANADGHFRMWDVGSRKEIVSHEISSAPSPGLVLADGEPLSVSFNHNGRSLAIGYSDGSVLIWDLFKNAEIRTLRAKQRFRAWAVGFDKTERTLYAGSDDYVIRQWNVLTGEEGPSLPENDETLQMLANAAPKLLERFCLATPNGKLDPEKGEAGQIRLRDTTTWKVIAEIVALKSGGWVTTLADGRFDTSEDLGTGKGLHWVISDEPLTPRPLELFMRQYYEPGLLPRLLKCTEQGNCDTEFKPLTSIAEISRVQPRVAIKSIAPAAKANDRVNVTVEVESVFEESGKRKSGVFDVRLFRDGQLVSVSTPGDTLAEYSLRAPGLDPAGERALWRKANDVFTSGSENVKIISPTKAEVTFRNIQLPRDGRTDAAFTAYAFNADRVKSATTEPFHFTIPGAVTGSVKKGRAFLISIGVNASENAAYDLRYAANDARKMQEVLGTRLTQAKDKYLEVVRVPLISDYARDGKLSVNHAQKAIIRSVFALLSGNAKEISAIPDSTLKQIPNRDRIKAIGPEDTLIITYAGHGYADNAGVFYLLPYDIGHENIRFTPEVTRKLISSDELSLWMGGITASEMIFIIDACYAAAAVQGEGFKPGPMGSRGLGQLAYDKDMKILAATQANDVALELGSLQHGLLSYALLQDGIVASLADADKNNEFLSTELLSYAEARVPQLYQEVKDGKRSLIINDRQPDGEKARAEKFQGSGKQPDRHLQQPTLFDFNRRQRSNRLF